MNEVERVNACVRACIGVSASLCYICLQDSVLAVESGLQPAADVECMCHLLLPEPTASRGQPTPKQAGQHPLCQKLLEQAPEQPQEQLPELAESSGDTGPTSGTVLKVSGTNLMYSRPCDLWLHWLVMSAGFRVQAQPYKPQVITTLTHIHTLM